MKTRNRSFGMLLFVLCVVASIIMIIPISSVAWGYIAARQDALPVDAPPQVDARPAANLAVSGFARQDARPETATTVSGFRASQLRQNQAQFAAPTVQTMRTNPFGNQAVQWPMTQSVGIAGADPMSSFVQKIRDAEDDEEKQKAIAQAKAALEKHYDRYIDGYEKQVVEMEKRVQKLRDQLDKRKDAKGRLVELKLEMLTNQAEGLGWPQGNRPNFSAPPINNQFPQKWRSMPPVDAIDGGSQPKRFPGQYRDSRPSVSTTYAPPLARPALIPTPGQAPRKAGIVTSPSRPILPSKVAPNTSVAGLANLNPPAWRNPFKSYLATGIELLEQGEYGEFLDRYMEPKEFRQALKSSTLDQVSERFEKEDADRVLALFEIAVKHPAPPMTTGQSELTWKLKLKDGSDDTLNLVKDKSGGNWYLQLQNSTEDKD